MKTGLLRFTLVITLLVVAGYASVAKESGNRAYVQSGPDGVFYARCIPDTDKGAAGITEVYRVRKQGDQLVDRYDWYTGHGVVLGWSPIAGKVALLAIRRDQATEPDKQVEINIYLGGSLLKSWTTSELQRVGAKVSKSAYGGERADFEVVGCEQIPGTNQYVWVLRLGDKKVSLDILTGKEYRR